MKIKAKVIKPGVKSTAEEIKIYSEFIKLDSFLKLANIVGSGGEAKIRIRNGEVLVNGEVCEARGKKLYPGDGVETGGKKYKIAAETEQA